MYNRKRYIASIKLYTLYLEYLHIVLFEQLTNYFIENKLLSPQQYAFRAQHSTEPAVLNLVDYLTRELDNGNISINIYLYFALGDTTVC